MSNIPDQNQPLVDKEGKLLESPRLFLDTLQRIINRTIAIFYVVPRFDSLALLNAAIPNPPNDALANVTGQGLATFKSGTWVKTSDDTTAII